MHVRIIIIVDYYYIRILFVLYVCMFVCMYVCTYVCMYIIICVYVLELH